MEILTRIRDMYSAIGAELEKSGGVLRCLHCGREIPLGNVAEYTAHGWPKCCGHTMRWVTQKQLEES